MSRPTYPVIPWPTAGSTSSPITLDGNQVVGFFLPTTIASSTIKFNAANTKNISGGGIIWVPINDSSGAQISFTVNASTAGYYGFSQDQIAKFTGVEILQMVAGSSEAANQNIRLVIIPRPSI